MKFITQILLIVFIWFSNQTNANILFSKDVFSINDISLPKTENELKKNASNIYEIAVKEAFDDLNGGSVSN